MNTVELDLVIPSSYPIRKSWDEDKMDELAQSIKKQGVIVPIKVKPSGILYEIVYGHRRVEAARRAKLKAIPVIIEEVEDTDTLIQALIENLQREDMHPLDVAHALKELMDATGAGTRDIERLGLMPHARVSHFVKLLDEEPEIQVMISKHEGGTKVTHKKSGNAVTTPALSETHVRSAREAGIKEPSERAKVLKKAANEELTYRETRQLADAYKAAPTQRRKEAVLQTDVKALKTADKISQEARAISSSGVVKATNEEKVVAKKRQTQAEFDRNVKVFLECIAEWHTELDAAITSQEIGKFSPEAEQFTIRRLVKFTDRVNYFIDIMERG